MIPVVVRRLAETDIEQALEWYASKDEWLGVRFTEEVGRTIDRIGTLPDQFSRSVVVCAAHYSTRFRTRCTSSAERTALS